jgi:hypothetical protein
MQRRTLLQGALAALLVPAGAVRAAQPLIEVYKSATCGCCKQWVEHVRTNGFTVNEHDVANPSDYREKFGVPQDLGSCHTGLVAGYAIEGHVPAQDIKRLLAERPKAKGLAVPGMPLGSPGMDGPRQDPYDVMLIHADGKHKVFRHVGA